MANVGEFLSVLLAASKDRAYVEAVEKMQRAFQELVLTEAEARRTKTDTIIRVMAKYDMELQKFKRAYSLIDGQLTNDAKNVIDGYTIV